MKILFTGASSFTGYWFVKKLAEKGNSVNAIFTKDENSYSGMRAERISLLKEYCNPAYNTYFGSDKFLDLISKNDFDILCHHAADVTDYKSEDFNISNALAINTRNINQVIEILKKSGCKGIVLTGSVFENNEGTGSGDLCAFSPYGLSKSFTYEAFRYICFKNKIPLGKFVIPNPFGPYEEPRFTTYLIKNWMQGKTPAVNTPAYIRDNIHVSLLAEIYSNYTEKFEKSEFTSDKINPHGYIESQGRFAERFAAEVRKRTQLECNLDLKVQSEFPEPEFRVNTTPGDSLVAGWDESAAWDELISFYNKFYGNS